MFLQVDLSKTLHRLPWFADLDQARLDCLAGISVLNEVDAGEYLFKEGDREDYLYILVEGQVVLEVEVPTRGQVPVYTAEILDVLGWSSMTPIIRQRTASARATQPSLLVAINSKLLQQMCEEDHDLGYQIYKRIANVTANRLMTTRLCLLDIISQTEVHTVP